MKHQAPNSTSVKDAINEVQDLKWELEQMHKSYCGEIDALENALEEKSRHAIDLQEKLASSESALAAERNRGNSLERDLRIVKSKLEDSQISRVKLKSLADFACKREKGLASELQGLKGTNEQLTIRISVLQSANEKLLSDIGRKNEDIYELAACIEAFEAQRVKLIAETTERLDFFRKEKSDVLNREMEAKMQLKEQIVELKEALETKDSELKSARIELGKMKELVEEKIAILRIKEGVIADLLEQLDEKQRLPDLKAELEGKARLVDTLYAELDNARERMEIMIAESREKERIFNESMDNLVREIESNDLLRTEFDKITLERDELKELVAFLEAEKENLKRSHAAYISNILGAIHSQNI